MPEELYKDLAADLLSSMDQEQRMSLTQKTEMDREVTPADYAADAARGVAGGAIGFAQSLGDIADVAIETVTPYEGIPDEMLRESGRPDWARTNTMVGGLTNGLTQGVLAFLPVAGVAGRASSALRGLSAVSKLTESAGLVGSAARVATSQGLIGGAIADLYGFRGDEGHAVDIFKELGYRDNLVTNYLGTNEDDSWIEGRLKNVVEGAVIGTVFDEAVVPALKGMKNFLGAKASTLLPSGILFQDPISAAKRGMLHPDIAAKLAGVDWADSRFDPVGEARDKIKSDIAVSSIDKETGDASLALMDAYAKTYAALKGGSVDDAYRKMVAGVVTEGTFDNALSQSPINSGKAADVSGQMMLDGSTAGPRGAVKFLDDGRAVIAVFKSADASTLPHELSHVFRKNLGEISPELQKIADNWAGVKDGAEWTRAQEEKWAETFESYLAKGEAPTPELKGVFERFKDWLTTVYQSVMKSPLRRQVSPQIKTVFNAMLGEGWNRADITQAKPSTRPANTHSPFSRSVRDTYLEKAAIPRPKKLPLAEINPDRAKRISDFFNEMPHDPADPRVVASYDALKRETLDQFKAMQEAGVQVTPWASSGEPYASSQAMLDDVEGNKNLYFLKGTQESSDNPLTGTTGIVVKDSMGKDHELTYNDLLRAVHDFYGHSVDGWQLDPRGRESAWLSHSQLYTREAKRALTLETRVRPQGGDQKVGYVPDWVMDSEALRDPSELAKEVAKTFEDALKSGLGRFDALTEAYNQHINYGRLSDTNAVREVLLATEELSQKIIDGSIGSTQSFDEMVLIAKDLGEDPEKLIKTLKSAAGDTNNLASVMVAGRALRSSTAQKLADISTQFLEMTKSGSFDEDLARRFADTMYELENVDAFVGTVQKNAARAVSSGNITVGADGELGFLKTLRETDPTTKALMKVAEDAASAGRKDLESVLKHEAETRRSLKKVEKTSSDPSGSSKTSTEPAGGSTMPQDASGASKGTNGAPTAPTQQTGSNGQQSVPTGSGGSSKSPRGSYTKGQIQNMANMAQAVVNAQRSGQAGRLVNQMKQAKRAGLLDSLLEVQQASILSGIPTFVVNGLSGGMQTALQPVARALGALSMGDLKETRKSFRLASQLIGSLGDMVKYSFFPDGNRQGLRGIKRVFTDEVPLLTGVSGVESKRSIHPYSYGWAPDELRSKAALAFGKTVRVPFMVNQAMEEFWGNLNYLAFVRTKAIDAAEGAIWKNPNITQADKAAQAALFVDAYIKDAFDNFGAAATSSGGGTPGFLHEDAVAYAKNVNFTQDLVYGFGQMIQDAKAKGGIEGALVSMVVPFVKVPTNIFRTAIRFTPGLGQLQEMYMRRMMSRTPDEMMRARGEMVMGAAFWGYAAYLAATGNITGGGPQNKAERDQLLASGWRPYSYVVNKPDGSKEYIEYKRADPIAMIFGIAADFADASAYLQDGERDEFAGAAVLALAQNLTNKTYLTGLSEAFKAITQPDQYGAPYVRNRLTAFVPNFMARWSASEDDYVREVRTVADAFKRRVPGLSESLPPRRDLFGSPVTPPPGFLPFTDTVSPGSAQNLSRMVSPIGMNKETDDAVKLELARLGHGFSMPSTKLDGLDLTLVKNDRGQDAYDRYNELVGEVKLNGRTLKDAVTAAISTEHYKKLPDPDSRNDVDNPRVKIIQRLIGNYRTRARIELVKEFPAIRDHLRRDSRVAQTPTEASPLLQMLNR